MAAYMFSSVLWISAVIVLTSPLTSGHSLGTRKLLEKNCIPMTAENKQRIKDIATRMSTFFEELARDYIDFDLTFARLDIERHRDDETQEEEEEKDLQIEIGVNDCKYDINMKKETRSTNKNNDDGNNSNDCKHKSDCCEHKSSNQNKKLESDQQLRKTLKGETGESTTGSKNTIDDSDLIDEKSSEVVYNKYDKRSHGSEPQLYRLDLDENGRNFLEYFQRNRRNDPIIAYVQPKVDYLFLET